DLFPFHFPQNVLQNVQSRFSILDEAGTISSPNLENLFSPMRYSAQAARLVDAQNSGSGIRIYPSLAGSKCLSVGLYPLGNTWIAAVTLLRYPETR
ncbi:MAG: hypothetical protein WBD95_05960, partial [Xanthobacteraceae bacterium]